MNTIIKATLALITIGMLAVGCSSDDDSNGAADDIRVALTPGEIRLTEHQKQLVDKGNDFAFRTIRQINEATNGSFVISPTSLSYLLGMLADGAEGVTRTEITDVLGATRTNRQELNCHFANIILNAPNVDKDVTMEISNAFFANTRFSAELKENYQATLKDYFKALVEYCDFSQTEATVARLNDWCDTSSHGMIKNMGFENNLTADWAHVLLSCTYFNGSWTTPFDEKNSLKSYFTKADGKKEETPMMRKTDDVLFVEDTQLKAISLPYGDGNYQMLIALPIKGNADDLIASLTAKRFNDLRGQMAAAKVDIMMPSFTTKTDIFLKPVLSAMGINTLFSSEADFSLMYKGTQGNKPVDDIKQIAAIEVGEKGTKAAAITATWKITFNPEDEQTGKRQFHALSPFVYVIYQQSSGAVFFAGKYDGQ